MTLTNSAITGTQASPKVSILIPSFNHAAFIEEAIRSVWEQGYPDMELVVVDDGSSDNSRVILARLVKSSPIPMKVIEQPNAGVCRALNCALQASTGEIIGMLASDDIMAPNRLKSEVGYFALNPELKVLFSNGQYHSKEKNFGDLHKRIKPYLKRGIFATRNYLVTTAPGFYGQAELIRRNFLINLGGFDEETGSDDWVLHIKMFRALQYDKEFLFIDRIAFYYRFHDDQMHKVSTFMSGMKRNVVRKYFPLENRSKFVCESYMRRAMSSLIQMNFKSSLRYIRATIRIAFVNGIPLRCLISFVVRMPGYLLRLMFRSR